MARSGSMSDICIRPAVRADFKQIAELQAASWRVAYRSFLPASYLNERVEADLLDLWRAMKLNRNDRILVAQSNNDGAIVGFLSLFCRPHPFIDNLHCHPNSTGKGIGSKLLSACFDQLRDMSQSTVCLSVIVGNEGARRFYLRHGGRAGDVRTEMLFGFPARVEMIYWDQI